MEKLLEMAKQVCNQAEVYSIEDYDNSVSYRDAKLHDVDSKFQSGFSLRIIKDGRLGFAYTRNLIDREELLRNALDSLKGGVEADYDFPLTREIPQLDMYRSSVESLSTSEVVEEVGRVCDLLKEKTDGEISVSSLTNIERIRIINSAGTDISFKSSFCAIYGGVIFPGSGSSIRRVFLSKEFKKMPDETVSEMIELYNASSKVVEPKGGKMMVLFMPNSMLPLVWRIRSGTSSKSVYEKTSPVADKLGKRVFDQRVTISDDPLDDSRPGARAFDDEGVECKPLTLVQKGVLNGFYFDLDYAKKLNTRSTGHGYRSAVWGGETVSLKPSPTLSHMCIKPGTKRFSELVKSIDRGFIIEGTLGAHSGNIRNGDYSVGVNPGLYVENGEIVGRAKDAMVAGNIYETLKHVMEVGDTLYYSAFGGWVPPMLFDGVSVATNK